MNESVESKNPETKRKPKLSWRKQKREMLSIYYTIGFDLCLAGEILASVRPVSASNRRWYWYGPWRNSLGDGATFENLESAKASALAFVKKHLNDTGK